MINFILRGNMKKGYIEIRGLIIRGLIIRGGVALVVCGSSREKNPHTLTPCINTCHIRLFAVRDKVLRSRTQPSRPVATPESTGAPAQTDLSDCFTIPICARVREKSTDAQTQIDLSDCFARTNPPRAGDKARSHMPDGPPRASYTSFGQPNNKSNFGDLAERV
jgi:hypothetical protein